MPTLISCPTCGVEGEIPDDVPAALLGCPRCGAQFAPPVADHTLTLSSEAPAPPPPAGGWDGLSVYVGAEPTPAHTPPPARGLSSDLGPYALRPPEGWNRPPVEVTAEDAAAHLDWLRGEVGRFNRFVALQLDQIRRSREEMARTDAQVTAAFVTREQEMNREKASLAARAAAFEKREADRAAEHAALRERLERRLAEVERLEATTLRKLEEVEEIEEALRTELETREREVELQRREVEEAARQLRSRPAAPTPTDDGPGATDLLGPWHCG